jgi:hypothetical protein
MSKHHCPTIGGPPSPLFHALSWRADHFPTPPAAAVGPRRRDHDLLPTGAVSRAGPASPVVSMARPAYMWGHSHASPRAFQLICLYHS